MSWSLDTRILSVLGATLAFVPSGADARRSQQIDDVSSFRRPVLPAGADTNSWLAYYNDGVAHLRNSPEDAEAGFVWATRIDPTRSQPLYARWITFWRRNMGLYKKYLKHDHRVLESPLILRVDSFYVRPSCATRSHRANSIWFSRNAWPGPQAIGRMTHTHRGL